MLNMVKMNLYQLFRMRSMYVVWLVMITVIVFTTWLEGQEGNWFIEGPGNAQESVQQKDDKEYIQVGMSVEVPTEPGEKVTVFDEVYANVSAKFIALMMTIFSVIFALADMDSGYVKNIGGQARRRGSLILSKAVAILVFTMITLPGYVLVQAMSNAVFFGYLKWGNIRGLFTYMVVQVLLHFSLLTICMAVAVIMRSKTFSIIFSVFLCMNITAILYGVVDMGMHKLGLKDFALLKYTVTGNINLLPMRAGRNDCFDALIVSVVFILTAGLLASAVFEKRDI